MKNKIKKIIIILILIILGITLLKLWIKQEEKDIAYCEAQGYSHISCIE